MRLILCRRLNVWIADVIFHRGWLVIFVVIINGPFFGWFRNWQVLNVKYWSDGGRQ
jgi:low affinity Fe/Cu permease